MKKAAAIRKMLLAGLKVDLIIKKLSVSKSYVYFVKEKMNLIKEKMKNSKGQRVVLTTTQVAIAKKLGVPIGVYARELIKLRKVKPSKLAPLAKKWKKENPWFGVDEEKTALALVTHDKLVKQGFNPKTKKYYDAIDARMNINKQVFKLAPVKQEGKPLDIKVGSEIGGLTLTKRKDKTYKWVRNDLLEKAKKDGFFATPPLDLINHPPHYTAGGIEVIDFIEAKGLGYNLGNVVKYVSRSALKGNSLDDLRKAAWYLDREINKEAK
jgi:hypothetical protein